MSGYRGQTYRIPQNGSWNANPNLDQVPQEGMVDVSNINLHRGGRQPRGGCQKVITTAISGTPEVVSLYQFLREDGSIEGGYVVDESADYIGDEYGNKIIIEGANLMAATDDGKIYQNYTTSLETGMALDTPVNFETFYDILYMTNGTDQPIVWSDNEAYAWDMGSPKPCVATIAAGAGVDAGTHSYKITFESSSGESTPGDKSNVVTTAGGNLQVNLTEIQVGPTGTTSRHIYRTTVGDASDYEYVAELANNTATTYSDNETDADIVAVGTNPPTTSLAFLPTDWQSDWPKYFLKHGRGVHKRLWAIGSESYPNILYISANGVPDFSDDNVTTMKIMTDKLTGMVEFGGNMLVFSRYKSFIINDVASAVINWGYQGAIWDGGAAHQKLIVRTPTDVAVMDETGNIYSIRVSEQTGDYKTGSLTKPHHLDRWIEENIDLLLIDKFHAIYDPVFRVIKWFMVKNGSNFPDICLVYFIDYATWSKHEFTNVSEGQIYHLCSELVKINQAVWQIYTGNEAGFVYQLESDILLDGDEGYRSFFKTPPLPLANPRESKMFDKLITVIRPKGTEDLYQEIWIDDESIGVQGFVVPESSNSMENVATPVGQPGLRMQAEIYNQNDDDFFVSEIMIDFEPLGSADEFMYPVSIAPVIGTGTGYIYGGTTSDTSLGMKDCEAYNLPSDSWASVTDMPEPGRFGHSACTILSKGYICGGYVEATAESTSCDEYIFAGNRWVGKTSLPSPGRRFHASSTILNKGYIYAGQHVTK